MKIKLSLLLLVIFAVCAIPLFAQDQEGDENLFCVTISAYKIYPHPKGYIFTYRKNSTEIGQLFLPYEWFRKNPGVNEGVVKGVMIALRPGNTIWPQLSVFYRNGEFSYVKLYAREDVSHESWGRSPSGDFDAAFENADSLVLDFGEKR